MTGHQEGDLSSDGPRGGPLLFKVLEQESQCCMVMWLVWLLLKVDSCSCGLAVAHQYHLACVRNAHALSKRAEKNHNFLLSIVRMESWLLFELLFQRPLLFKWCWMPIPLGAEGGFLAITHASFKDL